MVALHQDWLAAAGVGIKHGVDVEISPLFALDEQELQSKIKSPMVIDRPTYFSPNDAPFSSES
jgi:hypothetical protein